MSEQLFAQSESTTTSDQELLNRLKDLREWHLLYCRKIQNLLEQKHAVESGKANLLGEIRDRLGEEKLYQIAMQADIYPDYVDYLLHTGLPAKEE